MLLLGSFVSAWIQAPVVWNQRTLTAYMWLKTCSHSWWYLTRFACIHSCCSWDALQLCTGQLTAFSLSVVMWADLSHVISSCSLQFLPWLLRERKEKSRMWSRSGRMRIGRSRINKVHVVPGFTAVGCWGNHIKGIMISLCASSRIREEKTSLCSAITRKGMWTGQRWLLTGFWPDRSPV